MRALVARRLDGPDAIELTETAVPEPAAGQVRIKVAAAAVNPVDVAISTGLPVRFGLTAARAQFGLGWDVAGTVDAVGPNTRVQVGEAVIGVADLLGRSLKTHAEYVVLDADAVVRAPQGVEPVEAATYGLNGLTALQAIRALQPQPGQTVLVTGISGGVSSLTAQIARHAGLTVIGSARSTDQDQHHHQDQAIVDSTADLADAVRRIAPGGVDGLVDAAVVGIRAQEAVRNGGRHVHLQGGPRPPHLRGITVEQLFVNANQTDLQELVRLIEARVVSTRVADTYPLEQAALAYKRLAEGGVRGRLVLVP